MVICACYRHTNKVAVIHPYQLYGVWLEGFHSWQCVFCLYLCSFVPDGTEKNCIKVAMLNKKAALTVFHPLIHKDFKL